MNFIITLVVLTVGVYFGADHLLSSHLKTTPSTKPEDEKALVQNMAKFLEKSPDLRKKISDSGLTITTPTPSITTQNQDDVDLAKIARYFGSSSADQFFKNYLMKKKKIRPNNLDDQTQLSIEMNEYIHLHPKESIESMESAIQSIPQEMKAEREAITPIFIHSSINFIEELDGDVQTKKTYFKRLMNNTDNPEIKNALESHFPDLLN